MNRILSSLGGMRRDVRAVFSGLVLAAMLFTLLPPYRQAVAAVVPSNKSDVSTVAFRDNGGITYSEVAGQPTGEGAFENGSVADYPEGACIPFAISLTNNDTVAGDISITLLHDYYDDVVGVTQMESIAQNAGDLQDLIDADNLNDIDFLETEITGTTSLALASGGSVDATITGPWGGDEGDGDQATSSTDAERHYSVTAENIPADDTAFLFFCARLGVDASEFNGASLSVGVSPPSGGVENTAIQTNQVLALPSITLTKVVSGGDATADQWSFNVDGVIYEIADGQDTVVVDNVSPDGAHSIVEIGPENYEYSSGEGTNCVFDGEGGATATVSAGKPATNATCEFTNVYVEPEPEPAYIRIEKTVVNDDGGTATADSFSFTLDGDSASLNTDIEVEIGEHTVAEIVAEGYEGTFGGDCASDGTITAIEGETVTCSITNDDIAPILTITKVVVNDDEGTSEVTDFTLYVGETSVTSGESNAFSAGNYVVSEEGPDGYAGTFSGDCDADGNVSLALGDEKACTLTNNDIAPEPTTGFITVEKTVINDNDGEATVESFTFYVGETEVAEGEAVEFEAGTYTVSEEGPEGYTATFGGDCDSEGSITLAAEGNLTCTITNDDNAPTTGFITVEKTVINDNDGEATVESFTFYVGESEVAEGEAVEFEPGEYTVSEEGPEGYSATFGGDCDVNGSITLEAGEELTCTITNDDIAPTTGTITVEKTVINDDEGEATVENFTFYVGETEVAEGEATVFEAGAYTVSEEGPEGYTATFGGDCDSEGAVTVEAGNDYICTITNDDNEPLGGYLTVVKQVVNNDGGEKEASDFTLYIDETTVTSGESTFLSPGSYVVSEAFDAGYVGTFSGDCDVNGIVEVEADGQYVCTIINDDVASGGGGGSPESHVVVVTKVINDDGTGSKLPSGFTMTVSDGFSVISTFGGVDTPGFNNTVYPGSYAVGGSDDPNYTKSMGANCSGTIVLGQTVTCVVTYDDKPPAGGTPPTPPAPEPEPEPTPEPEVLGATDEAPEPMVLGATDEELPRTGLPASALLLLAAAIATRTGRRE